MIFIVPAVQADRLDPGSRRFLRDQLADLGSGVTVSAMIDFPTDCLISSADTDDRRTGRVVNHLARKVFQGTMHAQPGLLAVPRSLFRTWLRRRLR